jgi:protein dithiol:quinone oxidoreductase
MLPMNARLANVWGFLACVGLMAYALYSQHILGLDPCPLCIFQRVAVMGLGVAFALAALHTARPANRRVYAVLIALLALAGAAVAGRHIWVQSLPADKVPACGPGLDFIMESFPLAEALQVVLAGSGECHAVTWTLLGLSMPAWVLLCLVLLGIYGFAVNWRAASRS